MSSAEKLAPVARRGRADVRRHPARVAELRRRLAA